MNFWFLGLATTNEARIPVILLVDQMKEQSSGFISSPGMAGPAKGHVGWAQEIGVLASHSKEPAGQVLNQHCPTWSWYLPCLLSINQHYPKYPITSLETKHIFSDSKSPELENVSRGLDQVASRHVLTWPLGPPVKASHLLRTILPQICPLKPLCTSQSGSSGLFEH